MSIEKKSGDKPDSSLTPSSLVTKKTEKSFFSSDDCKVFFEQVDRDAFFIVIDIEGNIVYVNDGFVKASKYNREELLSQNYRILTREYHLPEFYKALWETISSGHIWHGEINHPAKNGTFYWVDTLIAPILGPDGNPKKYISIGFSITVQKNMRTIQLESQYAHSLIEASLDPLVTISAAGKITDVNEGLTKVTGVSREALIGTDFSNYFTEPDKAREGYLHVFDKGYVTDYPLSIRHINGTLTDVLYNASVYKNEQGNVIGVFAAARDVTAQRKAEEEVNKQRQKELLRLAELEKFQKITVGRELRMIELKNEIENLKKENEALKQKTS